ncbi:hypothetical protein JNW90_24250 [Micromonospora sp. STR1s_5]|nr:hypothetical protein [Micromonospora sp. STR1s_5]
MAKTETPPQFRLRHGEVPRKVHWGGSDYTGGAIGWYLEGFGEYDPDTDKQPWNEHLDSAELDRALTWAEGVIETNTEYRAKPLGWYSIEDGAQVPTLLRERHSVVIRTRDTRHQVHLPRYQALHLVRMLRDDSAVLSFEATTPELGTTQDTVHIPVRKVELARHVVRLEEVPEQ